jgi:hypothetical protein
VRERTAWWPTMGAVIHMNDSATVAMAHHSRWKRAKSSAVRMLVPVQSSCIAVNASACRPHQQQRSTTPWTAQTVTTSLT